MSVLKQCRCLRCTIRSIDMTINVSARNPAAPAKRNSHPVCKCIVWPSDVIALTNQNGISDSFARVLVMHSGKQFCRFHRPIVVWRMFYSTKLSCRTAIARLPCIQIMRDTLIIDVWTPSLPCCKFRDWGAWNRPFAADCRWTFPVNSDTGITGTRRGGAVVRRGLESLRKFLSVTCRSLQLTMA